MELEKESGESTAKVAKFGVDNLVVVGEDNAGREDSEENKVSQRTL